MFENVMAAIRELDSSMVIKADYTEELEALSNYENDLRVLQTLNTPKWKIREALAEINRIRAWIKEETSA